LFTLIIVTGIVILAPESLPTKVSVVCSWVLLPNKVLTVVAVRLIEVPITVLETLVPAVVTELSLSASSVFTPTPEKLDTTLTSAIVAVYPAASKVEVAPK